MKKIVFLSFFFLFLSSCGTSSQIEQAKQDILNPTENIDSIPQGEKALTNTWGELDSSTLPTKNSISVHSLSSENYLTFDDMNVSSLNSGEISFRGKAQAWVEKIVVSFQNATSKFPRDEYTLQTFKVWDTNFSYLASSRFQVLDYGTNIYIFTAYKGQESTQTRVEVYIAPETPPEKVEISTDVRYDEKIIGTENSSINLSLPSSTSYGNPVSTGENSMTYSNIDGFEIEKIDTSTLNCENISETLKESLSTWFYWNNCRDLISVKEGEGKKLIGFYVIRLSGEKYIYEKHYVDFVHGLRATMLLETGTGVTKDSIEAKNAELKSKNTSFSQTQLTDDLMKKIGNMK
jgi:hypothetical protein